jgi:elongation factor P
MPQITATQIRKGTAIQLDGRILVVISYTHLTPGKGQAQVQAKLRDLEDGKSYERRFRSVDKVEQVFIDRREMEYLYEDVQNAVFMDSENYEQSFISKDFLGGDFLYLTPNMKVTGEFYSGKLVNVALPPTVDLVITETEPGLKGATVTNVLKPATLETGLKVRVPPFIEQGEKIRVDTRTGEYLERAKE